MTKERLDYLDALRGWSILFVIAFHVSFPAGGEFPKILEDGARGVEFFYMLSAYTLFYVLDQKQAAEAHWVRNFFIRRFFRIAPMFYFAIAIAVLQRAQWSVTSLFEQGVDPVQLLTVMSFVNGFSPKYINSLLHVEWSVAIEMMFYAFVPLLYKLIKKTESAAYFSLICLVLGYQLTAHFSRHPIADMPEWRGFMYFWLPNHLAPFGFGVLTYFITRSGISSGLSRPMLWFALYLVLCFLKSHDIAGIPHHTLYVFPFALVILGLSARSSSILVNRYSIYLGRVSFSAYLLHSIIWPIINGQITVDTPVFRYWILFPLTLLLTALASTVTYRLIELRGMELGRRLIIWLETRRL